MPFTEKSHGDLCYMAADNIAAVHAFTTRRGGVSDGVYASLNLGESRGDEPERVLRNYELICGALGAPIDALVYSRQVHQAHVRRVTRRDGHPPFYSGRPEGDALITTEENLPLIIFTADCTPILLHDPVRGAVAAAHAGWRGTVRDIAGETVRSMAGELGCRPGDIQAAIGPCISACCYETGAEVRDAAVSALGYGSADFIVPRGDRFMVNLKEINRLLLIRAGIPAENISVSDECTSCLSEKYWSHRVTGGVRGSQASIIMLKGK